MQSKVRLEDKYLLPAGRVYMTGIQALVRLPLLQRERDRRENLNTAGFISGYRGSPLGGYDQALVRTRSLLEQNQILFRPGVNEDIAATSLWGTQQASLFPTATVDGVFGIWYGKGPGVDRSLDALKHANSAGTSRHGGVLAIMGDDHGCQSSTLAHQSDHVMAAAMIPVIAPSNVQEYLEFGILGFALSRFSGCWVGMKAVSETIESAASITINPLLPTIAPPMDFDMPSDGLNIRWPDPPLEQERRLHGPKMHAVSAFAAVNGFDRIVWNPPRARIGIVSTGKSYLDVCQALEILGINKAAADRMGIRLYKIGLVWPIEATRAVQFTEGLEEVIVVEEKRGLIEDQLARLLINSTHRPRILGKTDEKGMPLLPSSGEIDPILVARVIGERLRRFAPGLLDERLAEVARRSTPGTNLESLSIARTPYFCAGCPHNSSTKVPTGSRASAGIGCHGMVLQIPERNTALITHMGGEGANWIGHAPFTSEKHIFQNLGDGTYFHSGLLAIRAAAAAGVNITYKILYNDAVAMTGGQPHDGPLTVDAITRQVAAEGAKRIAVVTDEPEKYSAGVVFAPSTTVHSRDQLDSIQREFRDLPGLSVIVYDQTCAAEKRRRRKRGQFPDPAKRLFINDRVCEGCGDCSAKSNCVAIKPLDTEFGRKRQIDQSDCNKDYSCLNGFCPSFVTVVGGRLRTTNDTATDTLSSLLATLPEPHILPLTASYDILVTGVGGSGVVTIGALLGMAAHIEGYACSVLDITGLAQKNGAVMSHIRLSPDVGVSHPTRISNGEADLLLACDAVVAAGVDAISRLKQPRVCAVINDHFQPTADFVRNADIPFSFSSLRERLRHAINGDAHFVDATGLATALFGESIAANLFLLGVAWQKGYVPISSSALDQAIELNGVAMDMNKKAFAWGRVWAHDQSAVTPITGTTSPGAQTPKTLEDIVLRCASELISYQNGSYAGRYRDIVSIAQRAEKNISAEDKFGRAVATNLFKLMAYKDEYEVARLYSDKSFQAKLAAQFDGGYELKFHLAVPLLSPSKDGTPQKRTYGGWMLHAFKALAPLKVLRGTWFDIFSYTEERRAERALIDSYIATIKEIASNLNRDNLDAAIRIAMLPNEIRGYGYVKKSSIVRSNAELQRLIVEFQSAGHSARTAA